VWSQTHVLPGCGRNVVVERFQVVAAHIRAFVRSHLRGAGMLPPVSKDAATPAKLQNPGYVHPLLSRKEHVPPRSDSLLPLYGSSHGGGPAPTHAWASTGEGRGAHTVGTGGASSEPRSRGGEAGGERRSRSGPGGAAAARALVAAARQADPRLHGELHKLENLRSVIDTARDEGVGAPNPPCPGCSLCHAW
jgi:hypothetical protein